jgi:hypothetical protein
MGTKCPFFCHFCCMAKEGVIKVAIKFLVQELRKQDGLHEAAQPDIVVMKSIVNDKGESNLADGEVGVMVVNVEEEKYLKPQVQKEKRVDTSVSFANPEIYLNLFLLIAVKPAVGNETGYESALKRLSLVLEYFQAKTFFENAAISTADEVIDKIMIDLYTLSFEQQNQVWASLGAKYLPSVVYKLRLVVVDKSEFGEAQPLIKSVDADLHRIN